MHVRLDGDVISTHSPVDLPEDCQEHCCKDPTCRGFTWNLNKVCSLLKDGSESPSSGWFTGPAVCVSDTGWSNTSPRNGKCVLKTKCACTHHCKCM